MRYKSGLKVRYQEDVLIACLATDKARNIGFDRPKPLNTFATFGTLSAGARLDAYWSTQAHSSRKSLDATACFSKESIRGVLKSLLAIVPGPKSKKSHLNSLANGGA